MKLSPPHRKSRGTRNSTPSTSVATTTTPVAKNPVSSQTSTPTPVPPETTSTSSSLPSSSQQTTTLAQVSETAINDTTESSGPTITGSVALKQLIHG